jgi:hypothetical protein
METQLKNLPSGIYEIPEHGVLVFWDGQQITASIPLLLLNKK